MLIYYVHNFALLFFLSILFIIYSVLTNAFVYTAMKQTDKGIIKTKKNEEKKISIPYPSAVLTKQKPKTKKNGYKFKSS